MSSIAIAETEKPERYSPQHWQAGSSRLPSSRVMLPAYAGPSLAGRALHPQECFLPPLRGERYISQECFLPPLIRSPRRKRPGRLPVQALLDPTGVDFGGNFSPLGDSGQCRDGVEGIGRGRVPRL
jgi:hypothetical protein